MIKNFYITLALLAACGFIFTQEAHAQKRLKLLMVTDKFPWSSRPFINNQIAGLIDKGHDVYILATSTEGDAKMPQCLQEYDLSGRIFYKNLPKSCTVFDALLIQFPQSRGAEPIIQMHKAGTLQGKLVVFFRGEDLSAMIKLDSHRYDGLFKMADLCLPVCQYFKNRLIKLGCDADKVYVVHSAIDCDQFPYRQRVINPEERIALISACRLVAKKGIKFALLAAIRLHTYFPNLTYTIIGDGPEMSMLSAIIKLMDAQEYVHLVGQLPHQEVEKMLNKADIFILPSVTAVHGDQEGIPNALMEAMASGLPVVSSYHAGIPELIEHQVHGLLAAERDVNTLAENITSIIEHPEETAQMTQLARSYVEQAHNTALEINKLEQLLLNLVR